MLLTTLAATAAQETRHVFLCALLVLEHTAFTGRVLADVYYSMAQLLLVASHCDQMCRLRLSWDGSVCATPAPLCSSWQWSTCRSLFMHFAG